MPTVSCRVRDARELPTHVFISFSHDDEKIAQSIQSTLSQQNIAVWIDYGRITPGTPDWEKSIREALDRSFAVVFLASPSSRHSQYVRAELTIARTKNIPVFPLWIDGDSWSNSAPLEFIHTQYIDARKRKARAGVNKLASNLSSLINQSLPSVIHVERAHSIRRTGNGSGYGGPFVPRGYTLVIMKDIPEHKDLPQGETYFPGLLLRMSSYDLIGHFLDDVYTHCFGDRFAPFTYGNEWLLVSDYIRFRKGPRQVLAPWSWLDGHPRSATHSTWARTTPFAGCGIPSGSVWHAGSIPPENCIGIEVKRQALIDFLRDDEKGGGRIFSNEFFAPTDVSDDLPAGRVRTVICKSGFHFIDFSYMHPGARAISQLDNVEPAMEEYLQYFRRYRSDAL